MQELQIGGTGDGFTPAPSRLALTLAGPCRTVYHGTQVGLDAAGLPGLRINGCRSRVNRRSGSSPASPPASPQPPARIFRRESLSRRRKDARRKFVMAVTLEALDLAALLCSRVCHDLISPAGAIVNGLEVLDESKDEETKTFALNLIKKSARTASARLQFCRIAFGAAGSLTAP